MCRTDGGAPRQQGLLLEGLKKNDTSLLYSVFGQVWVRNRAAPRSS